MPQFQLTTVAAAKQRADNTQTTQDTLWGLLLNEVSHEMEVYLGRHVLAASRTEVYELKRFNHILPVRGAPITSIVDVKMHHTRDFSSVDAMSSDLYTVSLESGYIRFLGGTPWKPAYVQVTYTGGMATDTANFLLLYPALAAAADRELIERFQKAKSPTGTPSTARGKTSAFTSSRDPWEMMPSTRRLLAGFRKGTI